MLNAAALEKLAAHLPPPARELLARSSPTSGPRWPTVSRGVPLRVRADAAGVHCDVVGARGTADRPAAPGYRRRDRPEILAEEGVQPSEHEPVIVGEPTRSTFPLCRSRVDAPPRRTLDSAFVAHVVVRGRELYRDLPWRRTHDPYAVLLSRGDAAADAGPARRAEVGGVARGVSHARRARRRAARAGSARVAGPRLQPPRGRPQARRRGGRRALRRPAARRRGDAPRAARIGPATAAGVLAFAFEQPAVYLETNVRAVFLHELFADRDGVPDREIDAARRRRGRGRSPGRLAAEWYYALLDYGAQLKRNLPNPSRRSAHHTRQSRFKAPGARSAPGSSGP